MLTASRGTRAWVTVLRGTIWLLLLCATALVCDVAQAQSPPADIPGFEAAGSFAYTHSVSTNAGAFNLIGGTAEGTYYLPHWFGLTADVGLERFRDLPAGLNSTVYTFTSGPKIPLTHHWRRVTPFAQALVGLARLNANASSVSAGENSVAVFVGGGVDLQLSPELAIRAAQVDYMYTRFALNSGVIGTQNTLRMSAGVVFRFGARNR